MSCKEVFLITGGRGFLALKLIASLHREYPDSKIVFANRSKGQSETAYSSPFLCVYGDLKERRTWAEIPPDVTRVFHLAAVIPWKAEDKNRAEIVEENLFPLARLVEQSRHWPDLKQIIYSSSVSVYAHTAAVLNEESPQIPSDIYGASKLAGEQLLLCLATRGIAVAALRYSSIYGSGQYLGTILPVMVQSALRRREILVYGAGTRTQDFVHYSDAVRANLLVYKKKAQGVFNIGSGTPLSMEQLARAISDVVTGGEARVVLLPEKDDGDPGIKMSIERARRVLGYTPQMPLEEGLRELKESMERE